MGTKVTSQDLPRTLFIQDGREDIVGYECELIKVVENKIHGFSAYYAYCKGTCSKIFYISQSMFEAGSSNKFWFNTKKELIASGVAAAQRQAKYTAECGQKFLDELKDEESLLNQDDSCHE